MKYPIVHRHWEQVISIDGIDIVLPRVVICFDMCVDELHIDYY